MLQTILDAAGLKADACAKLLGVDPTLFQEWTVGQTQMPDAVVHDMSVILGVPERDIVSRSRSTHTADPASSTPAIWFKLRKAEFGDDDRELVLALRRLGQFQRELEIATQIRLIGWRQLFESIRASVESQAPARLQGQQAAQMFRDSRELSHGSNGLGDVLRGNLRSMGLLLLEAPIPESRIEGCCFVTGPQGFERPCVFVNSHHSTWFLRNTIILHEVAHAIFEASSGPSIDVLARENRADFEEHRADAFAQHVLAHPDVLRHVAQQHALRWEALDATGLATLVANIHVEARVLIHAALEASLISSELADGYRSFDIIEELRRISSHALTTQEYIKKTNQFNAPWIGSRITTRPTRPMNLPVGYVAMVRDAFAAERISLRKASEMLLIDEQTFRSRFPDLIPEQPAWA